MLKVTQEIAQQIINSFLEGKTTKELSNEFDISICQIRSVISGRAWKECRRPDNIKEIIKSRRYKVYSIAQEIAQQIIDSFIESDETFNSLSIDFNLSNTQVADIIRGYAWKECNRPDNIEDIIKAKKIKITQEEAQEIIDLYVEGKTKKELAKLFNVSKSYIDNLTIGKIWQQCEHKKRQYKTLADMPSEIVRWHPAKNGDLKPENVSMHSKQLIWRQCENGHEWQARADQYSRKNSKGCCPQCLIKWTKEIVVEKLNEIIQKLGRFPTFNEAKQHESAMMSIIAYKFGGLKAIKKEMGYEIEIETIKSWSEEKILEELKKVCDENNGEFPKFQDLPGTLKYVIGKSKNGVSYYRKKLGYKVLLDMVYYKKWENIRHELEQLIFNGNFPTRGMISRHSQGLLSAVERFGGMKEVANKMGYEYKYENFLIATDGHILDSSYELLLDEYLYSRNIEHQVHGFLFEGRRLQYDFKIDDIYIEIWGIPEYDKRGYGSSYQRKRKEKEKLYKEAEYKLVSFEYDFFWTRSQSIENKFDKLFSELGFDINKKKCEYKVKEIFKKGFNLNLDNLATRIKEIIDDIGHFPTGKEIQKIDPNLLSSIYLISNLTEIKRILGFQVNEIQKKNK